MSREYDLRIHRVAFSDVKTGKSLSNSASFLTLRGISADNLG